MIRVFLGYDRQEPVAFHIAAHSIHARASEPVSITPLMLSQLKRVFDRPRDPKQSTDFSFSRFLTPYLCNFEGWSLFMDGDVLVVDDIAKLWKLRDEKYAVMVVKHDHAPKEKTKFLNHEQTRYEKKNWSSVMLFNNAKCGALTPEYVQTASGLDLHRFVWLGNDDLIGELPQRWNWLVDYNPTVDIGGVSVLHYTSGGPYFEAYRKCSYSQEWFKELEEALHPLPPAGQGKN